MGLISHISWLIRYLKFNDTCDAQKSDKCMCAESHIGHILGQTGLY